MGLIGKTILKNTITNYGVLIWRMISSIILVRIMFLGLGEDLYGFWALLWAIFGYSLLLDFGFGQSIQKYTAEANVTGDTKKYNRLISTVVCSYLIMTSAIILATISLAPFIQNIFSLSETTDLQYYKLTFLVLGIGVAMVFPTGVFPEILVGLKRTDLKNYVMLFNITVNFIGIYLIFKFGYSILSLAIFTSVINFTTNIAMAFIVYKKIPGFHLSLKYFKIDNIKEILGFSAFAYLITFANMIIFRTDRLVLGVMCGVGAVAIYQVGTRVSEIMEKLTTQFQDTLAPIAASLHKQQDHERIKWILLKSNRIVGFISTAAFLIFYILIDSILMVWLKVDNPDTVAIARIMLISVFVSVTFRSASIKFLLMCNKHRLLAYTAIAEAVANIVLSVWLIKEIGVVGVAYGTLIPNVIISIFIIFPAASKLSKISVYTYFKKVYFPLFFLAIPVIAGVYYGSQYFLAGSANLLSLGSMMATSGAVYLVLGYFLFFKADEIDSFKKVIFKRK